MAGQPVDHVPVSIWRHFPVVDLDPVELARLSVAWQNRYDFDLVKFMPPGTYSVVDWGAGTDYIESPIGTRTVVKPGVTAATDWPRLARLDPAQGWLGIEVKALTLAVEALKGSVPILQTLFSPLTTALKLAGPALVEHMRTRPELVEEGLASIADSTIAFARTCLRAGAHGVFFSTQCGSRQVMTEAEHLRFGVPFDKRVLEALRGEARFVMMHLHGEDVMFDHFADYPANMVNWHDRHGELSLKAAAARFPDWLLVGGLDETRVLRDGPASAIAAQVADAIAQTGGRRLMVGPGCVAQIATPGAHYEAVVKALRG